MTPSMTATASAPALRGPIQQLFTTLERFPMSVIVLLFRIGVAMVFFKSGLTKIASWDITVQLFADEYALPLLPPAIAAYLGTTVELAAPWLLITGFATRFGAGALLGMTLTIQIFVYPENWSEHLMWASLLIYLLTRGPGPISVDHFIRRAVTGDR